MNKINFLSTIFLLFAFNLAGAEIIPKNRTEPIKLKSDRLTTDSVGRSASFSGNVVATQGDLTIFSDSLTVNYATGKNDVKEITAEGHVRIVQGKRLGFAGRAVYDNQKGVIRLEDKPRVQQDEDVITGSVIIYDVNENKSSVSGSKGERVEAVIHPSGTLLPSPRK